MRPYRQAAIWAYLRQHPGSTPRAIRAAVRPNITAQSVHQALQRLQAAGFARHEGRSWRCTWYALGDTAPTDGRGQAPASIEAMARERRTNWRKNLELAAIATGCQLRRPIGQIDPEQLDRGCELARLWRSPIRPYASIQDE